MNEITIQLDRAEADYVPGEPITGKVTWDLDQDPRSITLQLLWQTEGKGTQDIGSAAEEQIESAGMRGEYAFSFPGVEGPYSFSGRLITLSWLIEATPRKGKAYAEQPLTISPSGQEVEL